MRPSGCAHIRSGMCLSIPRELTLVVEELEVLPVSKKVLLPIILGTLLVLVLGGAALAQGVMPTPGASSQSPQAGATPKPNAGGRTGGFGFFGLGGQNWTVFDAVAKALNLSPTDLFNQLHSGKTLSQIEQAQKVDPATVQSAVTKAEQDALPQRIQQAVQAGRISQDEANWLLQGLNNGWLGRGLGMLGQGFGGMMGRGNGGMMGPGARIPRNFNGNGQQAPRRSTPQAVPTPGGA